MVQAGKYNSLKILRETDSGFYLDGEQLGEILMPGAYMPAGKTIGDEVDAFVYFDSEDRLVATTEDAWCEVGDFILLQVVQVNAVGAFLDWGLMKNLLVPFREQKTDMVPGSWHIVYVYADPKTGRLTGSAKVEKFIDKTPGDYTPGQQVELLIYHSTPLGYKVIVNNKHFGMLYNNEVFQPLNRGEFITGYIQKVRPDGKIDVSLYPAGFRKTETSGDLILEYLRQHEGYMPFTDKSPAGEIYETFGISKKNFKMALGTLFKNKLILIEENGIRLS